MKGKKLPVLPTSTAPGDVSGLPRSLAPGTLAALVEQGTAVALAGGDLLRTFRLTPRAGQFVASELASYALPGRACALAESSLGIVVAVKGIERREHHALCLARDGRLSSICDLPGPTTSLAAGAAFAYVVTQEGEGPRGRLLQVDLRQRQVNADRALDHPRMKLSLDAAGQRLLVTDARAGKVVTLGLDLETRGARPTEPATTLSSRDRTAGARAHPPACCCVVCPPPPDGGKPGTTTDTPTDPRDPRVPVDDGSGHDGQTGVPSPGGGTVVSNGSGVEHHPPGRGGVPCGRSLFWEVAALHRAGAYFLAADRSGQHVALLSADMNLLSEWDHGRGGAMVLAAEGTPNVVMHTRRAGRWTLHDVHDLATSRRPDLRQFFTPVETSKTFIGQSLHTLSSHGQGGAPTKINAVLLPVIEGDQTYTSPNLNGLGAFFHRTTEAVVRDFYHENSFGLLTDVNIKVFGVDVGPVGLPLQLPRHKLIDYFFPDYIGAAIVLTKSGVAGADPIVFDGRESLTLQVTPLTGGPPAATLTLPFYALAFQDEIDLFPVQIKFLGTEKLKLEVTTPAGAVKTLNLAFTARTFDVADVTAVAGKLTELATYLDGVMAAAEVAAGLSTRLFAAPKAFRIAEPAVGFGRLLVTFNAADTSGSRLTIKSATGTAPGGDPLGLLSVIRGTMTYAGTVALQRYLENSVLLAQEAAGNFGYNNRLLELPTCAFDPALSRLETTFEISKRYGGPGAKVAVIGPPGPDAIYVTGTARANSDTTFNDRHAVRDFDALMTDAFSLAIDRLRQAGQPTDALKDFTTVIVMPVEPPGANFGVMPGETWNVTPLNRPFDPRGVEGFSTLVDQKDPSIQVQSTNALAFITLNQIDLNTSVFCHELGHALGFGDLYFATGFRDELAYMGDWSIMDNDGSLAHHCGYHKLQANWIPDGAGTVEDYGRVYPFGLPQPAETRVEEVLLVPVELWRDSLTTSSRAAFGVDDQFPVAQLVYIDLGGDGATFGLVEAREKAVHSGGLLHFSQNLPGDGGILITNGISWKLDDRFAVNNAYRRQLQLLNPANVLRNPGDQFDLALAPELPVKGMKVEVVDRKVVEGDTEVYRIKLTRENAEFVDLYFATGDPYYKSPDLWMFWPGGKGVDPKKPDPAVLQPDYALGQPTDQGDPVYVPDAGQPAEPNWVVGRVRNRGKVEALDVKLNFFYLQPPGGGDGHKPLNTRSREGLTLIGSVTVPLVPGGDGPVKVPVEWDVAAGFSGHTCLLVEIEDFKIPRDAKGASRGSDDVWLANNNAQKNVDVIQSARHSPFEPIEFGFSIYNGGFVPETAYPEPVALPYGMKLTVTPPVRKIAAGETAIFHCKLELDDKIILTGCENDQRFRIQAWRQDDESSARWGGVEYEVQPRLGTTTTLTGYWERDGRVTLGGKVDPNPGGGTLRLRVCWSNQQPRWITAPLTANGGFTWSGPAPGGSSSFNAVAVFEGNREFGASRSAPLARQPPAPIN